MCPSLGNGDGELFPKWIRQKKSKYIKIISLMEHHLNHYKMEIWVTSYDKDGNAFIKPIISMPGNILLDLLSHSEETTQEDFSTYIYEIYKPNKRKDKSMLKPCISKQRKKELKIGNLSLLIPKPNFKLWKFWKKHRKADLPKSWLRDWQYQQMDIFTSSFQSENLCIYVVKVLIHY